MYRYYSLFYITFLLILFSGVSINSAYAQPQSQKQSVGDLLYEIIESDGIEAAVEKYKVLKAEASKRFDLGETHLNQFGYRLLGESKSGAAIAIFKLNTEMHPESVNVWDSLGEAYLAIGEYDRAIRHYGKVLNMLEDDISLSPQQKTFFRANANAKIGDGYQEEGDHNLASRHFKQSLEILEKDTLLAPQQKNFLRNNTQFKLYQVEHFDPASEETLHFTSFFGGWNAGRWDMQNAVDFKKRNDVKISYDGTNLYGSPVPGNVEQTLTGDYPAEVSSGFIAGDYRRFVENGKIVDISDVWEEENWDDIFPAPFKRMATYNGKPYFVPMAYQWNPVWYRKDIFEKHGLTPPETWNELLELCDRLNELGYAPFTVGVQNWPPPVARWFTILNLRLNGPEFHEQVMRGQISFNDDRLRNVFIYWSELFRNDAFADSSYQNNYQTAVQDLVSGSAVMYNLGEWLFESPPIRQIESKLDFFPFPEINSDVTPAEIVHTYGAFINRDNSDPETSKELLKWLASTESQQSNAATNRRTVANSQVDPSIYSDVQMRIIKHVNNTEALVPLFEFNTRPEFARRALAIFQEFWKDPENIDSVLNKLETARVEVFGKS